jgi:hypothetical protein
MIFLFAVAGTVLVLRASVVRGEPSGSLKPCATIITKAALVFHDFADVPEVYLPQ